MSAKPKFRFTASLLALAVAWPSVALAVGLSSNRAYLGKPVDPGFGFQDLQHRWYDPATGRFLSIDPVFWEMGKNTPDSKKVLGSSQAQNPTSYAGGNPIRYSDPEGRTPDYLVDPFLVSLDAAAYSESRMPFQRALNGAALAVDSLLLAASVFPAVAGIAVRGAGKAVGLAGDALQAGRRQLTQALRAVQAARLAQGAARGVTGLTQLVRMALPASESGVTWLRSVGEAGKAGSHIRIVVGGTDELRQLFNKVTEGLEVKGLSKNPGGLTAALPDGSVINYRPTSSTFPNPATIDLQNIPGASRNVEIKVKMP